MSTDPGLERTVMQAIASWYRPLELVMLATPKDKKSVETAFDYGLSLRFEAFADRGYTRSGYLVPRDKPGAVLGVTAAVAQAKAIASGTVRSTKGHKLSILPDTLCVHGDTPEALEMLKAIHLALQTPAD